MADDDVLEAVFDALTSVSPAPLAKPILSRIHDRASPTRRLVRATAAEVEDAALSRLPHVEQAQLAAAQKIATLLQETQDVRTAAFVQELARELRDSEVDPASAVRQPGFAEAVLNNFRRAMEVAQPCVLPALARLTLVSVSEPLDRFARGLGRVLVDLAPTEFALLVRVGGGLGDLAARSVADARIILRVRRATEQSNPELFADALGGGGVQSIGAWPADGPALVHVLVLHGLLRAPTGDEPGFSSEAMFAALESFDGGTRIAEAERDVAMRLGAVLRDTHRG